MQHIERIVLVVPNFSWGMSKEQEPELFIPYNLCLLGAILEQNYEVSIIDANIDGMSEAEFISSLVSLAPHLVGIVVKVDKFSFSGHRAANLVKQALPSVVTVMGGVYPTTNKEKAMQDIAVDYIVVGEGEETLPALIEVLNGECDKMPEGIGYRRDSKVIFTGRAPLIRNLDTIPLPAYHLIPFHKYASKRKKGFVSSPVSIPYARILTSRGCPQHCIFCQTDAIHGDQFRARSADNVLKELLWLKETYGITSFVIDDDNFFVDKQRVKRLLQGMIDKNLNLAWKAFNAAVFHIDEDVLELMKKSGCDYLNCSVESGVPRVLHEIIRKDAIDFKHIEKIIKKCKELNIFTCTNFVVGFPGETWDEIRETFRRAEELGFDYVKFNIAMPYPGTALYDLALKTQTLLPGFDTEKVDASRGWIATDQFKPADLSYLRIYEWDRINFAKPEKRKRFMEYLGITERELFELRRKTLQNL